MSSDKTEQPTAKRKREARRDGNLARSIEVVVWAQMLAAAGASRFRGEGLTRGLTLAAGPWQTTTRGRPGMDLSVHLRERDPARAGALLDQAGEAIERLEPVLGRYPFRRLNLLESPFASRAAQPGVILVDPAAAPLDIARAVARQWWGAWVTASDVAARRCSRWLRPRARMRASRALTLSPIRRRTRTWHYRARRRRSSGPRPTCRPSSRPWWLRAIRWLRLPTGRRRGLGGGARRELHETRREPGLRPGSPRPPAKRAAGRSLPPRRRGGRRTRRPTSPRPAVAAGRRRRPRLPGAPGPTSRRSASGASCATTPSFAGFWSAVEERRLRIDESRSNRIDRWPSSRTML